MGTDPHVATVSADIEELAQRAINAYNARELQLSYELYTEVVRLEPASPVWLERRGQVLVDLKRFGEAVTDFDTAEKMYRITVDPKYVSLGLLSNRALAYEGLYNWRSAIVDYDAALRIGDQMGFSIPYVMNSRGNCHGSLAAEVCLAYHYVS